MDSDYGKAYERLFREHWWWRAREEFLMSVLKTLSLPPRPTVLDIGCGGGWFFDRLATLNANVEGLEFDSALATSDSTKSRRIHVGPFDRTFDPKKKYSLILMLDVLEHLPDPEAALIHATELLEPNGRIVITVPAFLWLWTKHDELNRHFTRYSKRSFLELANRTPLRIDRSQYFFHWLVPLKIGVRLKEALVATDPSPPTVPPAIVNKAMYGLSRVEQNLWGRLPLPFGSSLLIVGGSSRNDPQVPLGSADKSA